MDLTTKSDFLPAQHYRLVVVMVTVLFSVSCQPNFWPAFIRKRQIRSFQNHRVSVSLFEFLYQERGESGATVLCYDKVYTEKMTTVMSLSMWVDGDGELFEPGVWNWVAVCSCR
jgi:hypothetical protein